MIPSQILSTVRAQVYETTPAFYTDAEIYSYMWQGEQELTAQIPCTETIDTTSVTSASGTEYYNKPSDVLYIERVEWDNVKLKKIDYRDRDALDSNGYGSALSSGEPYAYYEYGSQIGLYPVPNSINNVTLHYIKEPAAIVTASTSFTIPSFFARHIVDYCLFRMYAKDQDDGRANFHRQQWEINLSRAKQAWSQRQFKDALPVVKDAGNYPETELGMI